MVTDRKEKIILGIVGKRASGKNVLSNLLINNCSAREIVFSNSIRKALKVLAVPGTRENLSWLITKMRKRFGEGLLMEMAISEIKKTPNSLVICNGLRRKTEIAILRKKFKKNFILINLDCFDKERFFRIEKREELRRENKDKLNSSLREFLKEESSIETEKEIGGIQKMADYRILNNGDFEDLKKQTITFIKTKLTKK